LVVANVEPFRVTVMAAVACPNDITEEILAAFCTMISNL